MEGNSIDKRDVEEKMIKERGFLEMEGGIMEEKVEMIFIKGEKIVIKLIEDFRKKVWGFNSWI